MTRKWWIIVAALAALAAGIPFFPAGLFRAPIQRALERGLGRKVEIGAVHFTLFPSWTPAPGFTLDEVTIHEDPRAGIEPFAYMDSLGASVRLLSLFKHKLEFSSLNLGGQTVNINVVKTAAGPWNFQYLLGGPAGSVGAIPPLRMRGGRVNFKFGDTKSVFYFDDADLDVAPGSDGSVELRFGGTPARTDHSGQDFGRLFVNGTSSPGNRALDYSIELERGSLEETMRLFDTSGFGIQGNIALQAQLAGPPSELHITGQIQVGDVHLWDLIPAASSALRIPFSGALDLHSERLALSTVPPAPGDGAKPPVTVHLNAYGLLSSSPDWNTSADLEHVPVAPLLDGARRVGLSLPGKLTADGSASGSVAYSRESGLSGDIEVDGASIAVPDAAPLAAETVSFDFRGEGGAGTVRLKPTTLLVGDNRSVEVEGSAALGTGPSGARALDLKITTRGLSVADMRSFGLGAIPLLEHATEGTWRGWARFSAGDLAAVPAQEGPADPLGIRAGEWTSESQLLDARIPVDGLADPVHIKTASISLSGKRAAVTGLRADAGGVAFNGEYRWDPGAKRPHRFRLSIAQADLGQLQQLLDPALKRPRGFLARTLGLGPVALPEWLAARHAEGIVAIDNLTAADTKIRGLWTRLFWDAGMVHFTGLTARLDSGAAPPATSAAGFSGDLTVDLSQPAPQFHFEGEVKDLPWHGGRLDLLGIADAEGSGLQLLETARAEGRLRGRGITFSPDADFRVIAGEFQAGPGPARWKLSNLEVTVGQEVFAGSGLSQADGKMVLDLANRARQVRYAGALLTTDPRP